MAEYERAVKALSLIVAANSRQQLLVASNYMDVLFSMFVLPSALGDASAALPPHHYLKQKLLQLLCSAYANVTDLVLGPLHDDFTEDFVLHLTSVLLGSVCVMLGEGTDSITGSTGPEQLSTAQLVSSTGLIKALTAACTKFAELLMKPAADYEMVYSVAVTTLGTVNTLMQQWPGKRVLGRVFPPLLLPATRLALVMAQLPNPADEPTQSFGSQQQATDFPSWSQLDVQHLVFAGNLMNALQQDILHLDQSDFLQHLSAAQHILESQDVRELCVAAFATQVRKLYTDQQSSSDASAHSAHLSSGGRAGARSSNPDKVHPAVSASHDKVLALLGCKNTRMPHGDLAELHTINCYAHAVYELLTHRIRLPHTDSTQQMYRPPLPLPTWEAVLLLYVELQLLAPSTETVMVVQESIHLMCSLPAVKVALMGAGRGLSAAVAEAMLLLVPSAVQMANAASDQSVEKILELYGFSLCSVLVISIADRVADVLQKHPETAAAALEMAVRGVSADTWIEAHMLDKFLVAMQTLLEACSATVLEHHSSLGIHPEQRGQQDRPLLQLTLSCLKSLRIVLQTPNLAMDNMLQAFTCASKCVLLAVNCKPLSECTKLREGHAAVVVAELQQYPYATAASAPALSSTASDSKSVLLPLVTAARGLDILGCCFEKLLHGCNATDLLPGPSVTTNLQVHLYTCCKYVEWVRSQLWTVDAPNVEDIATRSNLVDMCKGIPKPGSFGATSCQSQQDMSLGVTDSLRRCQSIGKPEAMAAVLGPKLQLLGAAVCSALPIPSCCNNHQCVNTAHYTEQQLVRGKGCLCGCCRTARYCSAACQKKHWSKHKAVCNAIKQARLRSSASGSAQAAA